MSEFKNELAEKVVNDFRENQKPEGLMRIAGVLFGSPLLIPIQTEKEPEKAENGQYRLDPDQQVGLIAIRSTDGRNFFPMFTSSDEARKVYNKENIYFIPLDFRHYIQFVEANENAVDGIVINPKGANIPLRTDFLKGMRDAMNKRVHANRIQKGQQVHLRNPQGNVDALEAALISSGFHEEHVNRIYLKERIMDLEKPDEAHWFVVVDATETDPKLFTRIADLCKDALQGKEIEFMFTNQKLGQDIANSSKPIYEKSSFMI